LNITATDKRRIMQSLPAPGVIPAIDRFVQGYEGSDLYVNQLGEEVLVSAKGIPVAGWKLVAALPTAEAFAPIRAMQQRMLLAAIFLSLLASGLIWWMLKRLLQPIIATLQESDARHKAVIDSALDAIVVNDAEGRITEFNPAAERTFGHRRDEVLGKELAELLIPGGDGGTRRREFVEELAQGVPAFHGRRIEVPALHADGHEFPIELAVQQIKWDGQEFFIAFARDLTESKRTAALLREREEVFRALFETSQDAIMTLAPPSWAFTSGNPAALRMFGVRGEMEFASLGPGELSPETQPDGRPSSEKAREMIATAMREGAHAFEWTHQRLGGESFPAAVVLTRVALAERVFLQACVRDVSAERRAREELRASEDHLRKTAEILRQSQQLLEGIVEHIPVMVFVKDASDLHFELLNRAGEELLGYSRSDLLGKGNYDFWPKEQGDWFTTEDRKVLAKKEVTEIPEEPIQTASGETRYLHTWKVALRDENDEPRHLLGISVDITERKRTEAALAEALRAKSEFMANVTHELRTPLNSVIGFAELLKDEVPGPLNAKQAAFTADILAAGQHLHRLVQGILELSRLDVTGAGIERETVEIGAALEERVAAQRKAAEVQRVSISLEVAADVGSATLDPKALRRMLDALLDNAIKFNRDGGRVAVSARRAGGALEIAVADTGIGIAQEDLAKLFKPLTQLDAGLARRHGGVGLGLALARRLAELHGGTIEVESEHGKGSTFTLRLPIEGHS
jgi:PAS domain S-box-containing protein